MELVPPPFHGLLAEKPIAAAMLLLPQDGVNAVYLVIRMLFLAFLSPWPSCPAGAAGSEGSQGCWAGNCSIPCLPPAEPCWVVPNLKVKALGCSGR